jgi:hypothetical protein
VPELRWAQGAFYARGAVAGDVLYGDLLQPVVVFELFVPLSMGGAVVLMENALELPEPGGAREEITLDQHGAVGFTQKRSWARLGGRCLGR